MNIAEYISSGKLEAYVLGGLDFSEVQEVEKMAASYPEIKNEILSLQKSFEGYIQAGAVQPRKELKSKVLQQLSYESSLGRSGNQKLVYYKFATAASVALLVLCGGMALYFWSKWQGAEERLVVLEEQTNRYADQINKANYKMDRLTEDFEAISDTSVVKVTMKGVSLSPVSLAVVFWNKKTNEVFIDPGNLPKAPEGMQYQLWALKDGQPIDAGVFETEKQAGLQKGKLIENAQAYAVTLEKRGGSKQPTLSAMYVFGEV